MLATAPHQHQAWIIQLYLPGGAHMYHLIHCSLGTRVSPKRHLDQFNHFLHGSPVWVTHTHTHTQTILLTVMYSSNPCLAVRTLSVNNNNNSNKKCTQRAQTSADPEDPDFGLWTPGSEAWSGSPPKLYQLVLEPCPTLQKISSKSVQKFASNPMERQTDKQTNRPN